MVATNLSTATSTFPSSTWTGNTTPSNGADGVEASIRTTTTNALQLSELDREEDAETASRGRAGAILATGAASQLSPIAVANNKYASMNAEPLQPVFAQIVTIDGDDDEDDEHGRHDAVERNNTLAEFVGMSPMAAEVVTIDGDEQYHPHDHNHRHQQVAGNFNSTIGAGGQDRSSSSAISYSFCRSTRFVVACLFLVAVTVCGIVILASIREDNPTPASSRFPPLASNPPVVLIESSSSPSLSPASTCVTLPANTAQALETALHEANGDHLHLCDTEIVFDAELYMNDIPVVNLSCDRQCIFDGANRVRLFSFGSTMFTTTYQEVLFTVNFNVTFRKVTFQNGLGGNIANRVGGGGAVQFRGIDQSSFARFEECIFRGNHGTFERNGGAIEISSGWLELDHCLFVGNAAHTGGAISAYNAAVRVRATEFRSNSVCGHSEGAAIFHSSWPRNQSLVECVGLENHFENNADGICIDPVVNPQYNETPYDIIGCTKNCGEIGDTFCRSDEV